jgi:uncharacterized protein (DUF2235 family)
VAKNIILLSDGTGNSESSPFKTNVWRLYQAIDIGPPPPDGFEQIVYYDNGVGTESFKPLALLGQAIGVGVANNVKNLYTFLCRNYQRGDNIWLFGFSRGAFTVRVLAGLILRCGLVTADSDDELSERVKLAYAEYKRDVARRATATRPLILGKLLGGISTGSGTDHVEFNFPQYFPHIAFMGVWDTVDAYGMPVDELKEGIDRYVWPMTLADRKLSDYIDRVCHALSLDDERPTFRPVLWTEDPASDRLTQVWFAGVHANVGGGYPDDGLACVTLQWMMDEAARLGLRFYQDDRDECDDRADIHGEEYDSRSGLAGYFRYGPRDVDSLCDDKDHGVKIARPKIHNSALQRIMQWQVAYAPISFPCLPRGYDIYGRAAAPQTLALLPPIETAAQAAGRANDMKRARDAVFRKRVAYAVTVAFTIILAVLPVVDWIARNATWQKGMAWLGASVPMLYRLLTAPNSALAWAGDELLRIPGWHWLTQDLVGSVLKWIVTMQFLPGWLTFWLNSFANHPGLFTVCAPVLLWLFFKKSQQLQDQIFARAERAWQRIRGNLADADGHAQKENVTEPKETWIDPIVRWLSTNRILVAIYLWLSKKLIPFLFAMVIAAPIGFVIWLFFIPKFLSNKLRRKKYGVRLSAVPADRIQGTPPHNAAAARA